MKTVFDLATRTELISRITSLNNNSAAKWGKMDVGQMVKHCILADEMFQGKKQYKRRLIGRLFGQVALKSMLKDDSPMQKNAPTRREFKVKDSGGNLADEKQRWIAVIEEYGQYYNPGFEHWFFGKMTTEQVGRFAYKHCDHHLRQFGA